MQFKLLKLTVAVALAGGSSVVLASPVTFNAHATIGNGGMLTGTVSIDTATGQVLAADLFATVNQTFVFNTNVGGIPNYANTGLFVIAADYQGGYPIALIGLQETTLEQYAGGPIYSGSNVVFENLDQYTISSGSFTQLTNVFDGHDFIGDFQASGTVAGNPFTGTVTINRSTGAVLASTLTATIPRTYRLNINVGGTPNYGNTGLFVIGAGSAPSGFPLTLLGLSVANLIGFQGGAITNGSGLFTDANTRYAVTDGTLSPVPEPATFAVIALSLVVIALARHRRSSV